MTPFELLWLASQPVYAPLHRRVRKELLTIARARPGMQVLDVGGRKSHYTIGVPASITVADLPRETDVQKRLNLGINDQIAQQTMARRSNVKEVVYDDMTASKLPEAAYECVVAVEVLEHVEKDADFVSGVGRVLKPGGYFLMTTPNGDFVKNTNPDHKRHYKRAELDALLRTVFDPVTVEYAIAGGTSRRLGLRGWTFRRPVATLLSMAGNAANQMASNAAGIAGMSQGTHHLLAIARKRP